MRLILACFLIVLAYVVGSIPTGFIIARLKGIEDIRLVGSGNIGATNVGRHLGLTYFFLILLLDSMKAYLSLYLIASLGASQSILYLAALALLFGNSRSLFLCFTGGKGVATSVGIGLYLFPLLMSTAIGVWLITLGVIREVGIASVMAACSLPIIGWFYSETWFTFGILVTMSAWVIWLHRLNILYFIS
jgi:acyl phosphate:glycerol-3-phosphate acyltransferase